MKFAITAGALIGVNFRSRISIEEMNAQKVEFNAQ
jgi:hypothetical protein